MEVGYTDYSQLNLVIDHHVRLNGDLFKVINPSKKKPSLQEILLSQPDSFDFTQFLRRYQLSGREREIHKGHITQ